VQADPPMMEVTYMLEEVPPGAPAITFVDDLDALL
jgi:hypothetical protein